MVDAVAIMAERKISELPVIDAMEKPVGLIDITDVVALFPDAQLAPGEPAAGDAVTLPIVGAPRPKNPLFFSDSQHQTR